MLSLDTIVNELGGELVCPASSPRSTFVVTGLAPLETASASELSFLANPKYLTQLASTQAVCVIVHPAQREAAYGRAGAQGAACIVTPQPYLYFARLTQLWRRHLDTASSAPMTSHATSNIHPSAVVHPSAHIDPNACIGPLCVIERDSRIGAGTVLKSRVTISHGCAIGERCTLHSGVVIGADGFGFAPNNETGESRWEKIEQLGAVRIGDDVEIGANSCIDRGALGDTIIEEGAKIDNLVQIAHNVRIGKHTAVAGSTGIAGSAVIGAHCTIGGAAKIAGHLQIADNVHISGGSQVMRSIHQPGLYTGYYPLDAHSDWSKNAAALRNLAELRARVQQLEKRLAALTSSK